MKMNYKQAARTFKAFCDENRIQILDILIEGEHCACELLEKLQIGQSTLSHHMKILVDAEIVTGRKAGKWMYYSLHVEGVNRANQYLAVFSSQKKSLGRENR